VSLLAVTDFMVQSKNEDKQFVKASIDSLNWFPDWKVKEEVRVLF